MQIKSFEYAHIVTSQLLLYKSNPWLSNLKLIILPSKRRTLACKVDNWSAAGLNPVWHNVWKHEKFSSLEPPRGNSYETQWAGWQNYPIDVNIYLKKSLENFEKKSADKIWSKRGQGDKSIPPPVTNWVNQKMPKRKLIQNSIALFHCHCNVCLLNRPYLTRKFLH